MICLIYFIIALAVLITVLLFVPIGARLKFDKSLVIKIKIGFLSFSFPKGKAKPDKEKKSKAPVKEKRDFKKLITDILSIKDDITDFFSFVSEKCFIMRNLDFRLDFGTGDAAYTGIATGALNAFVYSVISVIHHNTKLRKWSVNINPDFEKTRFDLVFDCICTTRLVHIIRMGLRAFKVYKKYKSL